MWTPFELASEIRPYSGRIIRIVEAQHRISTNRLAATGDDQVLLEHLADQVKPDLPESARALPWLLASPFRYGLGRPSRFRAAHVLPGILYASEEIETAVSEAAYWRMISFSRSPGFRLPRTPTPMSAFSVMVRTGHALDLTQGKLASDRELWVHPNDYSGTQALAASAREAEVAAIRAPSARRIGGINVAVLEPAALASEPKPHSSWAFLVTGEGLLAARELSDQVLRFSTPNKPDGQQTSAPD